MDNGEHDGLGHVKSVTTDLGPELRSEGGMYVQPFFSRELSGKDWTRFVNNVKQSIRSSIEYKLFVSTCKTDLGLNNCSFLGNVVGEDRVEIELHHSPLTLHETVEIVADSMLARGKGITTMRVAHEVMAAHFAGLVGVVPLSETVHELVHAGKVSVHVGQVYGRVGDFLRVYEAGVDEEHLSKVLMAVELSRRGELMGEGLLEPGDPPDRREGEPLRLDDVIAALASAVSAGREKE